MSKYKVAHRAATAHPSIFALSVARQHRQLHFGERQPELEAKLVAALAVRLGTQQLVAEEEEIVLARRAVVDAKKRTFADKHAARLDNVGRELRRAHEPLLHLDQARQIVVNAHFGRQVLGRLRERRNGGAQLD